MRAILRGPAVLAAVLAMGIAIASPSLAADGDEIARLLAEQFAKEGQGNVPAGAARTVVPAQAPAADDERRMIEEIEMLERARAEAEARRDALVKAREAGERQETAQGEAADKAKDDARRAEERRVAEEAERAVEAARKAEAAALARMEAEREAEADRIDAALRKAREARAHRTAEESAPRAEATADAPRSEEMPAAYDDRSRGELSREPYREAAPLPRPRIPDGASALRGPDSRIVTHPTRVTVLLTMDPGHRGIRRHNRTGDPILCGEHGCYVSAGADAPADLMPLRRAFGVGRTLGDRAGACRNSLGCVFRGVDLVSFPSILQPVDMRILKHDRRQPQLLRETSTCSLIAGQLACTVFEGPDYTMWVVPEEVAQAAGPDALEQAVEAGLAGHEPHAVVRN